MDKIKIGTFIAHCRREKQITQEQLAELLGVTNKAVSKWETGCCLPDASLYEPLCAVLGITISELFAGERSGAPEQQLTGMLMRRLYRMSDQSLTFPEFENSLSRASELTVMLKAFASKDRAVEFLIQETGFPADLCADAYDFYTGLFSGEEAAQ